MKEAINRKITLQAGPGINVRLLIIIIIIKTKTKRVGVVANMVKYLPSKCETLSSNTTVLQKTKQNKMLSRINHQRNPLILISSIWSLQKAEMFTPSGPPLDIISPWLVQASLVMFHLVLCS
jgi:hypothetical protein